MKKTERVLIIDALNMFIRNYIVDPSLSVDGHPIGGAKGFMKSLQKTVREVKPDQIIICWDGIGGSRRRKQTNKNYKQGRSPIRLNRNIKNLTENQEVQNKHWQQIRVIEYLNHLPVMQFRIEGLEADDIIGHICRLPEYREKEKVILSMDKDFIQLVDDTTVLMRPIVKEVLNRAKILEQYNIHPNNFALARAIVGDKSDNIGGIKGAGLPTIAKRFPFLKEEKSYYTSDIIEHCEGIDKQLVIHKRILDNEKMILTNYRIMQLYSPAISPQASSSISEKLDIKERFFDKTGLLQMFMEDGVAEFNWAELYSCCKRISFEAIESNK